MSRQIILLRASSYSFSFNLCEGIWSMRVKRLKFDQEFGYRYFKFLKLKNYTKSTSIANDSTYFKKIKKIVVKEKTMRLLKRHFT